MTAKDIILNIIVYIVLVIAICYPEYFKTWDQRPYAKNSIGVFIARVIAIVVLFLVIIYDISMMKRQ